ncbi:hypothetical protein M406DRAFT_249993 [Cryphonectria parasitica EP155]|uniref:Uncharacterized protein n=1 Tax=Cryphonectria parasitica (strain ATCC 38755 / EP155) TaxID=660469 RepID=A0A9P4YAR3_CRYP1|nr:uncharacterized protein M406DRAFT_249993 [Cryphonectria parasitica EP155]KAF3769215.1 hypothetical protein M406DRAFT_249993 [Cryphonectria parasitica EP155]
MLCTACTFRSLVCKMMDDAKRCSQYICHARSCNGCEVSVSACKFSFSSFLIPLLMLFFFP